MELKMSLTTESGYNLMWMMVMFDLPVTEVEERKQATAFRNRLMDEGFQMSQFSIYARFIGTREMCAPFVKRIKSYAPPGGHITILMFTDKQFREIINIENRTPVDMDEMPPQLTLF